MPRIKSWYWRMVLAAAALLVICIALIAWWPDAVQVGSPAQVEATRAKTIPDETSLQMEARAAETIRQRLAKMPKPVPSENNVDEFPKDAVTAVLAKYQEMLAAQGLYNQDSTRRKLANQILDMPQGAEIASKTLTDAAFARKAFSEFQAEARFFSVKVLKEAAHQGHEHHLLRAATLIARELARSGSEQLDKGISVDLHDLLHAFIDVKGIEAFSTGDVRLLQDLGYSPTMPANVKHIYEDALFPRLKARFGRERASAMTIALIDW